MKVVVTGGCSGLGLSFTNYLAHQGYTVYALYNNSKKEFNNKNIIPLHCDLRNEEEIINVLENIDDIDILINNAAYSCDNYFLDKTKEEFMHVLEVNVVGTFLVTKYLFNKINKAIINISSNNAIDNNNEISMDYDASKAGVNMLTKDFSLIKSNIKVVSICPGWINTESVLKIDKNYLDKEMAKVGQKKLLDKDMLAKYVIDNIEKYNTGDIIEIKEI